MIEFEWFQLLVITAVGIAMFAPLILLALFFVDWIKDQLW